MIMVLGSLLVLLLCVAQGFQHSLMETDPDSSVWSAAVELRNGDQYYISDRVQRAVINNNFYVFQNFNLFHYSHKDKTTSFLGNTIPTHEPRHIALVPSESSEDGVDEGNELLIATSRCLLTLGVERERLSIEAGHCYESGIRDGPREFARFNAIGGIAAGRNQVWAVSDDAVMGERVSRLCLIHNNLVMSFGGGSVFFSPIHAISMVVVRKRGHFHGGSLQIPEGEEVYVAICWEEGGISVLWVPHFSIALKELPPASYRMLRPPTHSPRKVLFSKILANPKSMVEKNDGLERQAYLFYADSDGVVGRIMAEWPINHTTDSHWHASTSVVLQVNDIAKGIISLYVDFPFGLFLADSVRRVFSRVNTVGGCSCPAGYALVGGEAHCQVAPAGGYVDLWGNFITCLPGTFEGQMRATSRMACQPCPPFKIAPNSQSTSCSPCLLFSETLRLLPHNPNRTRCLGADEVCPEGSYLALGGCKTCPAGSAAVSAAVGICQPCPPGTYSNPSSNGILACTACAAGKVAPNPSSTSCAALCSAGHHCAPRSDGVCVPSLEKELVMTVSVLGVKAVGADAASNGTVYIASFQLLTVVDQGGSSINIPLTEFTLVRDLKLSQDEKVLFAAVTSQEILCFTFVGSQRMTLTRTTVIQGALIVGIIPRYNGTMLVHDAALNRIALVGEQSAVVYDSGRNSSSAVILAMLLAEETATLYILLQSQDMQKIVLVSLKEDAPPTKTLVPDEMILNPYMGFWRGRLLLSTQNAIATLGENGELIRLAGASNISGRVDHTGEAARFVTPGPMITARIHPDMLLVVDETALRVVFALGSSCLCDKDHYLLHLQEDVACIPCPEGTFAAPGTVGTCSACQRGQYFDASDRCVPCPKVRWWLTAEGLASCPLVLDTMTGRDAAGLSMMEIFWEMSKENPQHYTALSLMASHDYVSMHTLRIPLQQDSLMQDDAARGRFWARVKRIAPPPEIRSSTSPNAQPEVDVVLPGFWIVCSAQVLQTESCSCDVPEGGIELGNNNDITQLWNMERSRAASIDYASLLITDTEIMNISVTPTSLFVSRSDAGGGTNDNNPSVLFIDSVSRAMRVDIPPSSGPTPSESSFAACIAGWPATYSCPPGFLWVPPLHACVPCKPGFYYDGDSCISCPVGSFSSLEGSTACSECATARAVASSFCRSWLQKNDTTASAHGSNITNTSTPFGPCSAGYEDVGLPTNCSPCIPGFFRGENSDPTVCLPCPVGTYSAAAAQTACTRCAYPLVSTQWGGTRCTACAAGYVPSGSLDRCRACLPEAQYFIMDNGIPTCMNKTVLQCARGHYLRDGGSIADNQCAPCMGCGSGELMTPYDPHPCQYPFTRHLGAPYRCIPVESMSGLFARLSISSTNIRNFSIQYTPCEGLPAYASWARGPDPTLCFFSCNYAISEAGARQYSYYYYLHEQAASLTMSMVLGLPAKENLFLLDYPGLSLHLMLLSNEICLPCPKTQCGWGRYRPITDLINGCGQPPCMLVDPSGAQPACQVVQAGSVTQFTTDGCIADCTIPLNSYLSHLSPPGTEDNCGWTCKLGFFKDLIPVDESVCSPCAAIICEAGQEFIPLQCMPSKTRRDFCMVCPLQKGLAVLSPDSPPGVCKYQCPTGTYSSEETTTTPVCIQCHNMSFCPAGFRRVCAAQQCVACPKLPMTLWGSAVPMPSNTDSCQVTCKQGYHTLDLATGKVLGLNSLARSYDSQAITCTLCSLRPSVPCATFNMCPTGYYLPVPGTGACKPCPTLYDCAAGYFASSCVCTICPSRSSDTVFVHQRAVDALLSYFESNSIPGKEANKIVTESGSCPYVCQHNSVLWQGVCTPCSTFVNPQYPLFTTYYSVWNASNGMRWWEREQDPPHLPLRSSPDAAERRAGLCWPCPPNTFTASDDPDLCRSSNPQREAILFEQAVLGIMEGVILTSSEALQKAFPDTMTAIFTSRRLLSSVGSLKAERSHSHHASKTGLEIKGIQVHPKLGFDEATKKRRHHEVQMGDNIKTCPTFAEWYDVGTKTECICKRGFVRHMESDVCVLEKHKRSKGRRKSTDSVKVVAHSLSKIKESFFCKEDAACPERKYKDGHGNCRLCPLMHAYNASSGRCECAWACPHQNQDPLKGYTLCPGNTVPLNTLAHDSRLACGCPKGHQRRDTESCEACPKGTYSPYLGHSLCMACPPGESTMDIGAERAVQCMGLLLIGSAKDELFVHPQAREFSLSPLQDHQRMRKK